MITRTDRIFIYVSDIDRAIRFYGVTLGLKRISGFEGDILFDTGNVPLMLVPGRGRGGTYTGADVCLWTDDINGDYGRLVVSGVNFFKPPSREKWGGWLTGLYDSEGNRIYLIQY
ncbi:VOC family protein [bacterium]|nr:VOC family protein [bacterium]